MILTTKNYKFISLLHFQSSVSLSQNRLTCELVFWNLKPFTQRYCAGTSQLSRVAKQSAHVLVFYLKAVLFSPSPVWSYFVNLFVCLCLKLHRISSCSSSDTNFPVTVFHMLTWWKCSFQLTSVVWMGLYVGLGLPSNQPVQNKY